MTASVAWQPVSGRTNEVSLWFGIAAVAAAFVALAVWFVVSVGTTHGSTGTTPTVQQGVGNHHTNNLLCVPAPGTRYC